jgi:hypothetical protein
MEVSQLDRKERIAMSHKTMTDPQLGVGVCVRVRCGVVDPDYPDLSIAGWTGTIVQTNDDRATPCLVHWDWNTLEHADPAGQARRKQNGLEWEEMWLAEEDLLVDPASAD